MLFRTWKMDLSTKKVLKGLKGAIPEFESVIDIGASDGRWSKDLLSVFPNKKGILVEANSIHQMKLEKFIQNKDFVYEICAAGDTEGSIFFDNSDPLGGLASHEKIDGIEVPVNTVDNLVKKHNLPGGYLLKLDTHGFEVPIFEGATETLKKTSLIIVETYNYDLTKDSLKFWEMCMYLDKKGFRPVGLSEIMYRKYDGTLWQFDLMFISKKEKAFQYNDFE